MQTILGSGGAVSTPLAKALRKYTKEVRLVSRNPKKVNKSDELFAADLLNSAELLKAIEGSEVAYLTAGLPYNLKIWKENWPKVVKNVIEGCKKHNCKLVFFDNMYMYKKDCVGHMTEETPIKPTSEKGKIRANIAQMILDEVGKGELTALIARCADYYGPSIANTSMLTEMVFKPFSMGKKANWIGSVNKKHSFTYTLDAAKATALLGNTPDAFQQVWHLPTAGNTWTGKEWINNIAVELGVKPKFQRAPKFLVRILGLFIPIMREMPEMMYQYENDYFFDSAKFEKKFDFKPTFYAAGIKEIIAIDYSK